MKAITSLCVGTVLLLAASLGAAPIASDSFESYAVGPVAGSDGGTGWSGGWGAPGNATTFANVFDASADPLTYTPGGGLLMDGGALALEVGITAAGNVPAASRALATPLASTFFVGYQVRYHNTGAGAFDVNNTFSLHLSSSASSTTSLNFGLRSTGTTTDPSFADQFMVRNLTGSPAAGDATGGHLVPDTDYYLVAMLGYSGANTFDTIQMWVNPTATDNVDTPNGDVQLALADGAGLPQVSHVFFRQAALQTDDLFQADRLVIGGAWEDVVLVPEPSVWALAFVGGLGWFYVARRRTRR